MIVKPVWDESLVILSVITAIFVSGCASTNVNPPVPKAKTGYVDLYSSPHAALSWDVRCMDKKSGEYKKLFYDVKPPEGRALRLAFPPGRHRLGVTCLNRLIEEPAVVEVDVTSGLITPVKVILEEGDKTSVRTEQARFGPSFKSRFGRGVKIAETQTSFYRISVAPETPVAYQPKEKMSYP